MMKMFNFKTLVAAVMAMGLVFTKLQAQDPNVKVTTGVVAAQQGSWDEAMVALNLALKDPSALKPANVPKAFYWRGKSRMGQLTQFMQKVQASKGDTTGAYKFENVFEDAFKDFKAAKAADDGKWGDKITQEYNTIYVMLLNTSIQGLNALYSSKDLKPEEKKEMAKGIVEAMVICNEIKPEQYLPMDISGQANLIQVDSAAALKDFNKGIVLYEKTPLPQADLQVAYIYYRSAVLERYFAHNLDNSLKSISAGKVALEKEWEKAVAKKASYEAEAWKKLEDSYNAAKADLQRMEIDILLNFPDKLQETCKKIEDELAKNPKDYNLRVAYANLLEKLDVEKSIAQYELAMSADPGKEIAPFNLGALYNNLAKEKYDKANGEADYSKAQALQNEGNEYLKKAKPAFEKALAANPKSLPSVKALKQICITLSDDAEYAKYKEMEKQLQGGGGQ